MEELIVIMKFYYAPMESITIYLYRNIYEQLFGEIDKYYTPFIMPNGKRTFKTRNTIYGTKISK